MSWKNAEQSVIRSDLAGLGLIGMQLNCLFPHETGVAWTFDDGTTAEGKTVTHLFPAARPEDRPSRRKN